MKAKIIEYIQAHPDCVAEQIAALIGVTNDCVRRHVREMYLAGNIIKTGEVGKLGTKARLWRVARVPSFTPKEPIHNEAWTRPPVKYVENRIWGL